MASIMNSSSLQLAEQLLWTGDISIKHYQQQFKIMNEIEILQQRVTELEEKLNQFILGDSYNFQKDLKTVRGGRLGFYGVNPVRQQSGTGTSTNFNVVGGTVTQSQSTWDAGSG